MVVQMLIINIYLYCVFLLRMKQQLQAESNLQVESLQLTHYLNDWIVEDRLRGLNKVQSIPQIPRRFLSEDKTLIIKDKDKDKKQERTQVCRIQFPIIQERSKSSKDLFLPLIKPRSFLSSQQLKTKPRLGKSEQKLSYPPTVIFKSALSCSITAQAYQRQLQKRLARKRKRSPMVRNPEINSLKKTMDIDVTEIKAMLIKQLKNSRRSALKDSAHNKLNQKQSLH